MTVFQLCQQPAVSITPKSDRLPGSLSERLGPEDHEAVSGRAVAKELGVIGVFQVKLRVVEKTCGEAGRKRLAVR